MCLAVLCNTVCCIVIVFQIGGTNADFFFPTDWIIVTTLLIRHCQSMQEASQLSKRPKTCYILHLSQIATANTIH
ncbi:hypothetical protein BDF19DRAFT_449381 [Syncephalis fuscata]|nr:hypothetical protein BDF19DRAFT_449381 [Syncephalis fuscata]